MQEATDEVHNGVILGKVLGTSNQERLAVANHALHSLAGIQDNLRKTLEYMKQEAAREYQVTMRIGDKTSKKLCATRNDIAKSLYMAKTKACIAQTFGEDKE